MTYLKRLAEAEGIEARDAAALLRMDRKRKKKSSNEDWKSGHPGPAPSTLLPALLQTRGNSHSAPRKACPAHGKRPSCQGITDQKTFGVFAHETVSEGEP